VLMGGVVLYPTCFTLYFWKQTISYMLWWKLGEHRNVHLEVHFIGSKPLNHNS
jgi:hypothetical protein